MPTRRTVARPSVARSHHSCYPRRGDRAAALMSAVAIAALLAPATGRAHDFWVEHVADGFVVRYGHLGGEVLPIDGRKVKAIRCGEGTRPPRDVIATARFSPTDVQFSAPCASVSVLHDGGYWSLTPDGEVNLPRSKVENVVRAWASRQYAKWVDARSPAAAAVLGDDLEVVPVTDLSKAAKGDKVTVRVLSAARPVPNAVVAIGHHPLGETDSKGEIRLRLRDRVESISTSIRRPGSTPDADVEVIEASLTFEVGR